MIVSQRDCVSKHIVTIANQIMCAGRTAPKSKGNDGLEIVAVLGEDRALLSAAMRSEAERTGLKFLLRDADNVDSSDGVILVGIRTSALGLNCGYCGYDSCGGMEANPLAACAINHVDVGIALGSMSAMAADLRVDSRIMFSVGLGASAMGLLKGCKSIFGMPISISSKSPFFDR